MKKDRIKTKYGWKYLYKGEYRLVSELSVISGDKSPETIRYRINSGMAIEDAVELPVRRKVTFPYNGKRYTKEQIARKVGKDPKTIWYQIYVKKRSVGEIIEYYEHKKAMTYCDYDCEHCKRIKCLWN